jgi:hypothetical protein
VPWLTPTSLAASATLRFWAWLFSRAGIIIRDRITREDILPARYIQVWNIPTFILTTAAVIGTASYCIGDNCCRAANAIEHLQASESSDGIARIDNLGVDLDP